jgi:hypothetical protein
MILAGYIHVGDMVSIDDHCVMYAHGYSRFDMDVDYMSVASGEVCIVLALDADSPTNEVYVMSADKQGWISLAYISVIL